ncbi:MAG: hypothetical protein AYK19_22000 [Theionarchaea archaeon DG-70-1]|nr:MAG: hypothetical protein AYK19_22000 [Theionarchaea archaeon DG-70-1]
MTICVTVLTEEGVVMAADSLGTLQVLEEYRLLETKRRIKRKILNHFRLSFFRFNSISHLFCCIKCLR